MPKAIPVLHNVTRMYQHGLIERLPNWVSAMRLVPPSAPAPRAVCRTNVRGVPEFETGINKDMTEHYEHQIRSLYPPTNGLVSNQLKHTRTFRKLRPQAIVYPEDRLRQRFYRDHPYELVRSQTLVESSGETIRADYPTPLAERKQPISGEDVIQYQLYLVSTGLTIDEAYEQAVREFRQRRLDEEAIARNDMEAATKNRLNALTSGKLPSISGSSEIAAKYPRNYDAWLAEDEACYKSQQAHKLRLQTMQANRGQIV